MAGKPVLRTADHSQKISQTFQMETIKVATHSVQIERYYCNNILKSTKVTHKKNDKIIVSQNQTDVCGIELGFDKI